jgi:hypothetical protein
MTHDVFISYSTKDKVVADAIVAALEGQGYRCWYAPRDIKPGAGWGEAITDAINECKIFVMVFSKNSNQSKRVLEEVFFAITEGKTVIPFRIENLDPTGAMRLHLSMLHWLDAYQPSWRAHLERLIESVSAELGLRKPPPSAIEPPAAPVANEPVKKGRKASWLWIGLAVVLIVLLSSSGFWWLEIRPKSEASQLTAIAISSYTPDAVPSPTQTSTSTPRPAATATHTPKPTPTHTPRPTITPTAPPAWVTEFADPIKDSLEGHPPNQYTFYENQKEGEKRPLPTWLNFGDCPEHMLPEVIEGELIWEYCTMTWTMWYTDFMIEMPTRHLNNDDRWSFYFRNNGFTFYPDHIEFMDDRGGVSDQVEVSLVNPYSLHIIVKGYETALYVNDQPILYGKLTTGFKNGEARWFKGSNSMDVAFEHIYIWDLNNLK